MSKQTMTTSDAPVSSDWRRLLKLITPYWRSIALATVLLAVSSLLGLVLPLAIRWLVDTVFSNGDLSQLNMIALGLLGIFVAQSVLAVGHTYLLAKVGQQLVANLRMELYNHIQRLPLRFFADHRTGEIVSRVSNDVAVVQETLTDTPTNFLRQMIIIIGGLGFMLTMNWQLTLLTLGIVPPLIISSSIFGRRLERLSKAMQERLADATVTLEEMLSGIRVVKSFVREQDEQKRYKQHITAAFTTAMSRIRVRSVFGPSTSLFAFAALTFLLWYGGRQVVQGVLTPGELIAFLFYMMMVAGPMGDVAGLYGRLREALGAGQRLFEMLDTAPELFDAPGAVSPGQLRGGVRFVDVGFTYNGVQQVLHNIQLDVRPGEIIAIVGPSGAGKTTLVNLIPRFFEPTSGRIEFDGYAAPSLELRGLRAQIGVVPQETFLFGGTVRENILYGRPDASEEEIIAASRAANAHEFIERFPDGYETIVGEKGIKLSVGQRQRVAIARVLLKDPRILILDEATSAQDSESERQVQEALERLMADRTTFVIAHRLSTIQRADRIVVIQEGRIVEEGPHVELLDRDGLYRRLWSLQFASPEHLDEVVSLTSERQVVDV